MTIQIHTSDRGGGWLIEGEVGRESVNKGFSGIVCEHQTCASYTQVEQKNESFGCLYSSVNVNEKKRKFFCWWFKNDFGCENNKNSSGEKMKKERKYQLELWEIVWGGLIAGWAGILGYEI